MVLFKTEKYKGIAVGSASGYGFEVTKGNGENALFFESSIDMLSYMQLHQNELDNHRLISMMGVKPNIVEATMERYHISPEECSCVQIMMKPETILQSDYRKSILKCIA